MKKKSRHINFKIRSFLLLPLAFMLLTAGCTEEIDIGDTVEFEDLLVVDANITNELMQQSVFLSRSFRFEESEAKPESDAMVMIVAKGGEIINFYEDIPGHYLTDRAFSPEPGQEYQLQITTSNGKKYLSDEQILPSITPIEKVYATREINSLGNLVLSINVDSYDPEGKSKYYRYEYEETYEIEAPWWIPIDFVLLPGPAPGFTRRGEDQRVCYNTTLSKDIIQTSTVKFKEDRISKFQVRSLSSDDKRLRNRYSILVKQYVQSSDAYTYYNVLDQMSGSDNPFSTIQPGQLNGNMSSEGDRDEKVLGFFELSSVSEKRIFVDFRDIFPDERIPSYFTDCPPFAPLITDMGTTPLRDAIENGTVKFLSGNGSPGQFEGPYYVVVTGCGDCRVYGSSDKPEFWEDR